MRLTPCVLHHPGDWSYPIVDASKEDVRRRLREEEEGRVHGRRLGSRLKHSHKGKGRHEADEEQRPSQTGPRFSYGQLGEVQGAAHLTASPPTSHDHPRPEGEMLISGARHAFQAAIGREDGEGKDEETVASKKGKRRGHQPKRMPSDAIDLVVEDFDAEEEEAIRERRRGEPGGPKKRVYRRTYLPKVKSPESGLAPMPVPGGGDGHEPGSLLSPTSPLSNESVRIKDSVSRDAGEQGSGEAVSTDEVVRLIVQEEELVARQTRAPGADTR